MLAFVGTFVVLRVTGTEQAAALVQATWALMIGSLVALAVGWLVERKWAPMPLVTGLFSVVFGAFTLLFNDPEIVKLQITVMNGLLAAGLLGGLLLKANPAKALMGGSLSLSDGAWKTLGLRYGLYFLACAVANEIVRHGWGEDVYVGFRSVLWVAAILFGLANLPLILKDRRDNAA